jgi:cytoskeletal protein CcmA (bactofilin family)
MFNKKNDNQNNMSSNNNKPNSPSVNMISEGTTLEGTLKTKSDVRVAGTVDGEVNAKGKVIISSTGNIKGNIEAVDADIAGHVDGKIKVTNKLVLRDSAEGEGDTYNETHRVEEGAQIKGEFHMTQDSSSGGSTKKSSTISGLSGTTKSKSSDKDKNGAKEKETKKK